MQWGVFFMWLKVFHPFFLYFGLFVNRGEESIFPATEKYQVSASHAGQVAAESSCVDVVVFSVKAGYYEQLASIYVFFGEFG